jgi:hypothetical protein
VEIDINQSEWNIEYGPSREQKVTLKVGDNIPQSMRVGDEFTLSLILPHSAMTGDSVSIKIRVVSID